MYKGRESFILVRCVTLYYCCLACHLRKRRTRRGQPQIVPQLIISRFPNIMSKGLLLFRRKIPGVTLPRV